MKEADLKMEPIDLTEEEDSYRNPDPVRREVLQEDLRPQWEKDLDEAIYQSMEEFDSKIKEQDLYEKECLSHFNQLKEEREKNADSIITSLERLAKLDSKTKDLYEILEPILFSYKEGVISHCELDENTFNSIFASLRSIRLKQSDREFLQSFFVKI